MELSVPLQPFHNNLTYAVLCTITSFEAVIKGLSSNRARKQKQKQRNKWFCSDPSLMFTSCSSRPLRLLTSHSHLPVSFSSQHFFPPHTLSTSLSLMCLTNKYILFPQNMQLKLTRFFSTWNKTVLPQNTTAWVLYALCSYYKLQLHFKANLKYSFYLTIKCNLLFGWKMSSW